VLKVKDEILQEIIVSRRTHAITYLALNKKLITDIANVKNLLIVITYIDITNCYNKVAYPFASLST